MLTIAASELKAILTTCAVSVSRRGYVPGVKDVSIVADSGYLTATTIDLDTATIVERPCEYGVHMTAQVRHADVLAHVRTLSGQVEINGRIGGRKFEGDDEQAPVPNPATEPTARLTLWPDSLRLATTAVLPCAADDDSRPVLAGVLVRALSIGTTLVTADGFRLATCDMRSVAPYDGHDVIIPATSFAKLRKILPKGNDAIFVHIWPDRVKFSLVNGVTFWTRTVEGTFPNYGQVFPPENTIAWNVSVNRAELLATMKTAAIASKNYAHLSRWDVMADGITIEVAQDYLANVDCSARGEPNPDACQTAFNARFIAEILAGIGDEYIGLKLADGNKPMVIEHANGRYLVMPIAR